MTSLVWWIAACGGSTTTPGDGSPAATDVATTPTALEGLDLFGRLAGLWTGPNTGTPIGDIPLMNVDFRAADDHALWGRVDVDPDDALRFTLEVEDGPALIYRNGGYFRGMLRDDRTVLTEVDPTEETWRFCHVDQGCDYIDAVFDFSGPDALLFDVQVRGAPHVHWTATRAETRVLAEGFPATDPLPSDAPLPTLPELVVTVSWASPLTEEADVWAILTTTPCLPSGCVPSRGGRAVAAVGATTVDVPFPEIFAGDYLATGVLDRDRNLGTTFLPGPGDGTSLPNRPVTVAAEGETTFSLPIVIGG